MFILQHGFKQSKANYSLFVRNDIEYFATVLVYMDDIILVKNNLKSIEALKSSRPNTEETSNISWI